jgi:CubicO group peptidase (beta-lactamase class C family)
MKIILFFIFTSIIASGSVPLALDLENIKKENKLPGLISAFYQNGKIKEIAAVGDRKIHERFKLTTQDKFHLGSCTKAMTATLAAIAVEKGLLSWETKLSSLFNFNLHPGFEDVSFDKLLSHRSGVAYFSNDGDFGDLWHIIKSELYPPRESRALMALTQLSQKPHLKPGEYKYSNTGYMIAANILEELMGDTYENLLKENVFNPLGMKSCGFGPTSNPSMRTAIQPWGHYINDDGKIVSFHGDNPPAFNPAGGVHCNFKDWLKFLSIHLDAMNGKYSLLTGKSFKKLHTAYPAPTSNYTYGGWGIVSRSWADGVTLTHGGSNTLNTARVWIVPNKNAIMMSATNIQSYKAMEDAIVNLINRNLK